MSYCSAWCPWALGNIYYGSITPSPTFSSIKLHHFSLQLSADQLKERCLYHTPHFQGDSPTTTHSVSSLVWSENQEMQGSHASFQIREEISLCMGNEMFWSVRRKGCRLNFLNLFSVYDWRTGKLRGKKKPMETKYTIYEMGKIYLN